MILGLFSFSAILLIFIEAIFIGKCLLFYTSIIAPSP